MYFAEVLAGISVATLVNGFVQATHTALITTRTFVVHTPTASGHGRGDREQRNQRDRRTQTHRTTRQNRLGAFPPGTQINSVDY